MKLHLILPKRLIGMKLKCLTTKRKKKKKTKIIYKKSKAEVKNIQLTDWVLTFLTIEFQPRKNFLPSHDSALQLSCADGMGRVAVGIVFHPFLQHFYATKQHIFSSLKYAPDFLWASRHFLTCHNSRNTLEIVVGLRSLLQKITGCGLFSSSLNRAVYFVWLC